MTKERGKQRATAARSQSTTRQPTVPNSLPRDMSDIQLLEVGLGEIFIAFAIITYSCISRSPKARPLLRQGPPSVRLKSGAQMTSSNTFKVFIRTTWMMMTLESYNKTGSMALHFLSWQQSTLYMLEWFLDLQLQSITTSNNSKVTIGEIALFITILWCHEIKSSKDVFIKRFPISFVPCRIDHSKVCTIISTYLSHLIISLILSWLYSVPCSFFSFLFLVTFALKL